MAVQQTLDLSFVVPKIHDLRVATPDGTSQCLEKSKVVLVLLDLLTSRAFKEMHARKCNCHCARIVAEGAVKVVAHRLVTKEPLVFLLVTLIPDARKYGPKV